MARPIANRGLAAPLLVLALMASARPASGDANVADQAAAQALFDDARKLLAQGDYAHACPKLVESQRLDPGGGTILNLALCHEAVGKTASAWTEFNDALSEAIRDRRPEREARARQRIAALEPKLSRLTILVSNSSPDGLEIAVDGVAYSRALWGVAVPTDPGLHTIVAHARGKTDFRAVVVLGPTADAKTVEVPELADEALPNALSTPQHVSAPVPEQATSGTRPARRTVGWIVGGVGLVALGIGSYFGVEALEKRSASNADCPRGCTQQGVNLNDTAITDAWVSDFGVGLGLAAAAVGVYLVLSSPSSRPADATLNGWHLTPSAWAHGGGAAVHANF